MNEFWANIGGQAAYEKYKDLPRYGEWVQLAGTSGPRRMDAGIREERHFNRIIMAAMAQQNIPYQREESFDSDGGDEDEGYDESDAPCLAGAETLLVDERVEDCRHDEAGITTC